MIAKLRGPLAWTLAVEGAGVFAGLLTLRLAASHFGVEGFGAYTVARRLVSVAAFPLLLGFGIALPRAVARARADTGPGPTPAAFGLAAGGWATLSLAIFFAAALALATPLGTLAFGSTSGRDYVGPAALAAVGIALHTLSYSWFRGHTAWTTANLLQFGAVAIVPPVAVLLAGASTATALRYTGLGWIATGTVGVMAAALQGQLAPVIGTRAAGRELLRFGLPRVPGELALFGLLALPAVMVAHRDGLAAAGFVSFALSLVQLSAAALAPVGTLLLPIVSREAALGKWAEIRRIVHQMLAVGTAVSLLLALMIVVAAPQLVHLLLGDQYLPAIPTARWIAPAAVPYAIYLVLRNPLDAIATHPHNTRNLLLAVLAMYLLLGPLGASPAAAILGSFTLLGALSGWDWLRLYRRAAGATA